MRKVCVVGVGMTKFHKPGQMDYPVLAKEAGEQALADARVGYDEIQQAFVGYVYGDSTCGQRAVYQLGLTGIPIYNVNNNCSTGSTALMLGWQAVAGMEGGEGGLGGGGGGGGRVCARAGIREDGKGIAGGEIRRSHEPSRSAHADHERAAGIRAGASGGPAFRRRGPRAHEEVRH